MLAYNKGQGTEKKTIFKFYMLVVMLKSMQLFSEEQINKVKIDFLHFKLKSRYQILQLDICGFVFNFSSSHIYHFLYQN